MNDLNKSKIISPLSSGALDEEGTLPKSASNPVHFENEFPFKENEITDSQLSSSRKTPSGEFKIPYARGGKVIKWNDLAKTLMSCTTNIKAPADSFIKEMPLLGLSQLGEMMFLKILPKFGSFSGPLVGMVLSSLLSYLNGLFFPHRGPSLQDEIKRITGKMIDSNNYELMRLSTNGIFDVYSDFILYLDSYLKRKNRDDSREQILNKFDALIAVATKEMPTLRELSDGVGLPLYMQVASVIINAYREILSRKRELNLDDKYYNTNMMILMKKSSSWVNEAGDIIREKFEKNKNNFNEASAYLRNIYTGGYAMLLAAYKTSFSVVAGVNLEVRNTAELYTDNRPSGPSWESVIAIINEDIIKRKSLLSTLEMVGHKDNVLRICQEYFDGEGRIYKIEGQSCRNWQENPNAYLVKRDFKINQFRDNNITGELLPNTFTANTPNQGTYLIELDSPSGKIRAGRGNTDGLYNINIPGYFFSGLVFYAQDKGTCVQNAGWGLFTQAGIFRNYEGIMVKTEIDVDGDGNLTESVSCEFDLNNSGDFPRPNSQSCRGYSDILLGKNIIVGNAVMKTRIYPKGDIIKLTEKMSYKVLLLVSEDSVVENIQIFCKNTNSPENVNVANVRELKLSKPLYTLSSLNGEKFGLYEVKLNFLLDGPIKPPYFTISIRMRKGHFASATLLLKVPPSIKIKNNRVVAALNHSLLKDEFLRRVGATSSAGTVFIDMSDKEYLSLYGLPGDYEVPLKAGGVSTHITLKVLKDSIPQM